MVNPTDNSSCSSEDALRNPVILNRIFLHFPSNFLISSCRLVNKTWNRLADTFLRDHKKCFVPIPSRTGCQTLQDLEKLCTQAAKEGRVIPFNGFRIQYCGPLRTEGIQPFHEDGSTVYANLGNLIKLKYLEIDRSSYDAHCPAHNQLLAYLRTEKTTGFLRTLTIENVRFLSELFRPESTPDFPQLEQISISDLPFNEPHEIMERILRSAPNLKRIYVPNLGTLTYIPPAKYSLLCKIQFHIRDESLESLFREISEAEPKLVELDIIGPFSSISNSDDEEEDRVNLDEGMRQPSNEVLEQLLKTSHTSLKTIYVKGDNPLGRLSFPALRNLAKITMHKCMYANLADFWNDVISMDYRTVMPNLEEIELIHVRSRAERPGIFYYDGLWKPEPEAEQWPTTADGPRIDSRFSSEARKLTLVLEDKEIHMAPLKSLAPKISSLHLRLTHSAALSLDAAPFAKIWEFWPELVELEVSFGCKYPDRNHDAIFCGLHEEEVEFLKTQTDEYLQTVHIVPVRPSVTTMLILRRLKLQLTFWDDSDPEKHVIKFISKVTQLVAFRRMKHVEIDISGTVEL